MYRAEYTEELGPHLRLYLNDVRTQVYILPAYFVEAGTPITEAELNKFHELITQDDEAPF